MTNSLHEDLLGYLLDALDDQRREEVERCLAEDEDARRELAVLRRALVPLDSTRRQFDPPPGLAARTCRFVLGRPATGRFEYPTRAAALMGTVHGPSAPRMHPFDVTGGSPSRFYWQDVVMAIGVMVAASLLLFPAIHATRTQARILACQDNLRELGMSLTDYSERHDGYFPKVPSRGNLAAASVYAPILAENKLLPQDRLVVCPGSRLAEASKFRVPSLKEIRSTTSPSAIENLQETMGGSYGYSLGYQHKGRYHATRNLRRANFAIVSDAPSSLAPGRVSDNHGRLGQNVLFEDGHVSFTVSPRPGATGGDDFFLNDNGDVAAGVHLNDAVIASGATPPLQHAGR
ncbi:MAG TPA: hypothetical protein VJL29_09940 [Thermoguttaceae bacterium]|nr:hypothetical protein [Thermoguttaceae bacterium]